MPFDEMRRTLCDESLAITSSTSPHQLRANEVAEPNVYRSEAQPTAEPASCRKAMNPTNSRARNAKIDRQIRPLQQSPFVALAAAQVLYVRCCLTRRTLGAREQAIAAQTAR
jgi:hypothetical protein